MGECCVCGKETAQRCGPCGRAGFDLFFCSTVHQRIVWPAHKQVCGPRSNPFFPPDLSLEEAALLRKYAHIPFGPQIKDEPRKKGFNHIGCKYSAAEYLDDALDLSPDGDFDKLNNYQLTRVAELCEPESQPDANIFVRSLLNRAMIAGKAARDERLTLHLTFYPVLIHTLLIPYASDLPVDVLTAVYHQSLAFISVAKARAAQPHDPPSSGPLSRDILRALFHRVFDPLLPFCRFSTWVQAQLVFQSLWNRSRPSVIASILDSGSVTVPATSSGSTSRFWSPRTLSQSLECTRFSRIRFLRLAGLTRRWYRGTGG